MANASKIAAILKAAGIPVQRVSHGDEDEDGAVYVTDSIHVQVPTYGTQCSVTVEVDKDDVKKHGFIFLNPHRTHAALITALKEELARPVTFRPAYSDALDMMAAAPDLEPTSAYKQAASDRGIQYGPDMEAFVLWARKQAGTR